MSDSPPFLLHSVEGWVQFLYQGCAKWVKVTRSKYSTRYKYSHHGDGCESIHGKTQSKLNMAPLIPAHQRQRRMDLYEFPNSLVYIASSRLAWNYRLHGKTLENERGREGEKEGERGKRGEERERERTKQEE